MNLSCPCEYIRFLVEYCKYALSVLASRFLPRLRTNMQMIFDLLKYRKLLKEDAQAIELFGMYGLWHTKYYMNYVGHVDIFETNTIYHNLSKIALGSAKVSYFNQDSLVYASQTNKRYEIVVADTPMSASFYDRSGLPVFWNSLLRIATPQAVVIVNVPTWVLPYEQEFVRTLSENAPVRKIKDVFFVPRNNVVSYCVVVIHDTTPRLIAADRASSSLC